jgi:hypothetical protein
MTDKRPRIRCLGVLRNSWIQLSLQNESALNESRSMNVFRMRVMTFTPDKSKPDIDRESDTKTYTRLNCLDVIIKQGIH